MTAPRLVTAESISTTGVRLTFDQNMGGDARLRTSSYSFDGGLRVEGVQAVVAHPEQIDVTTTEQIDSRSYTVFVSAAVQSVGNEGMNVSQASTSFVGTSTASEYVVKDLEARSSLDGRKIELYWNDPDGAPVRSVAILRRERSWAFDSASTDVTIVYNGVPEALQTDVIGGFQRTFTDSGLRGMTYYYYTVVVSPNLGYSAPFMTSGPESRTFALATDTLNSEDWLVRKGLIPKHWFTADAKSPANYTLQKIITIIGAWLDVLRSHMKAGAIQGKWTDAPFPSLGDLNKSIGFEPEGESYDFDTLRRTLLQMGEIFAVKGRKIALEMAVMSLVEWTSVVQELGVYERRRSFGTWNPDTLKETTNGVAVVGSPWVVDQWAGGRLQDAMGNWFDVTGNSTNTLVLDLGNFAEGIPIATDIFIGTHTVQLDSVAGIVVGQRVCVKKTFNSQLSVLCVTAVDGATRTITFWNTTPVAFSTGSALVTWRILAPQLELRGDTIAVGMNTLTVNMYGGSSGWAVDQWVGFKVRDSAGTVHIVTGSSAVGFTFNDGLVIPSGSFQLARDFTGVNPLGTSEVSLGDKPTLYNPLWDRGLRGTRFDPFFYLYGGYTGSLTGAWGPCDVGVYITAASAVLRKGRVTGVSTTTITDTSNVFATNTLIGNYLNPNQNQGKLFRIVSNTSNSITVSGDVSRIAKVGQGYVVLTPRNAQRYRRLQARISEFVEDGIRVHILFI